MVFQQVWIILDDKSQRVFDFFDFIQSWLLPASNGKKNGKIDGDTAWLVSYTPVFFMRNSSPSLEDSFLNFWIFSLLKIPYVFLSFWYWECGIHRVLLKGLPKLSRQIKNMIHIKNHTHTVTVAEQCQKILNDLGNLSCKLQKDS